MRIFFAVIGGIVAAIIVIFIAEAFSHMIYPPPKATDMENPEAVRQMIQNLPVGALIIIIIGWAIGSFAGGVVSTLIIKNNKPFAALTTGTLLMLSGIINLMMFPHPLWMWIFGLAVNIPFAYLGFKFVSKNTIHLK